MIKVWSDEAWNDYLYWFNHDNKRNSQKINRLINDSERTPCSGIGKPEPLKHDLSGKWSRRITAKHRLIYRVEEDTIFIYSVRDQD